MEKEIELLQSNTHVVKGVLMTPETRFSYLGDTLVLDTPLTRTRMFSVGDIVIAIGTLILVSEAMVYKKRRWSWS
jgi:hypothetical protein